MVGWYLHKTKCQVKIPYWVVTLGWPVALALIASLIFSMVNGFFEIWPTAFYVSMGHTGTYYSQNFVPFLFKDDHKYDTRTCFLTKD